VPPRRPTGSDASPKLADVLRERDELARRAAELEAKVAELDVLYARSERTVKALRDVGLALGSTLDLDQLLELILRKIADLLEADRATLYLLDEQRQRLLSRIILGDEARSIELPIGAGIAGHVAKYGQTVRIKDAYRDRRFSRQWDEMTGYRTRSILAAPLKNHVGRTIGVIQVLNKRGPTWADPGSAGAHHHDEFGEYDEELLTVLATQAAVSIDNSRLFLSVIQKNMQLVETKEQLEHRVADLKLLFELESSMARAATFDELARAVITEAARACGAQAGGLMVDEGEDGVWLYFLDVGTRRTGPDRREARLAGAGTVHRLSVRRGEGIAGQAMRHNEAQHVACDERGALGDTGLLGALGAEDTFVDGGDRGVLSRRIGALLGMEVTSAIAMPLEGPGDQPIGALALYNATRPGGFTQDARALLRLVSANASTAVRLYLSRVERERSERLTSIGRLFSSAMHDLRTPLSVVHGYVQLMAKTSDAQVRAEQARIVAKQFEAIVQMQQEVLAFARGERSILLRKVFLETFFAEAEKHFRREIEGTKVELVMEVLDRGVARFDEVKLMRLLHNLVRNAVEAMSDTGGTLTVRVERVGEELCISVADTGRGIPEDVRGRLFQSFVTSGKRGGTGLGLSIVKKIVEEHGGLVDVTSSQAGTRFVVRLPQPRGGVVTTLEEGPADETGARSGAGRRADAPRLGASVAKAVVEVREAEAQKSPKGRRARATRASSSKV
jgi:signal transduction histidine kinase/putative methionine-R-sulfoxide reductase with GAF domain